MNRNERFPYQVVHQSQGRTIALPYLPTELEHKGKTILASGIVDSGATVNVLPYNLGIQLGAVWEQQHLRLELSGNLARCEARAIAIHTSIGSFAPVLLVFAWAQTDNVPLIFGQMNFFLEFNVCFYGSESCFEVKPVSQWSSPE